MTGIERAARPEINAPRRAARSSPIVVRTGTLADLDVVVAMRMALLRLHGGHAVYGRLRPDADARARTIFGRQLEGRDEAMLLAEQDGDVVGCLRCVRSLNSPLLMPDEYCYVSSVYVRPDARRRGVLRALLAEAERWCAVRGIAEMRLHNAADNEVAGATWEALGFSLVEQLRQKSLPPLGPR